MSLNPSKRLPLLGVLLSLGVGALVLELAVQAQRSVGMPFPSVLVDPYGRFSNVQLPAWAGPGGDLRFPDRLIAVDQDSVGGNVSYRDLPADRLSSLLEERRREGRTSVELTFERDGQLLTITGPIRFIGAAEVSVFFLFYLLMGGFILSSGVAALAVARTSPAAMAYALWSAGAFAFLSCFFDYHTTRRLVPLFPFSIIWVELGCVWMAYAFPEPLPQARRLVFPGLIAVSILAHGLAVWVAVAPILSVDADGARLLMWKLGPVALFILALVIVLRFCASRGRARAEIRSMLWGLASLPATIGAMLAALNFRNLSAIHLLLPLLAALLPVALGYSLIRHNILGTPALLTRRLLMLPIGATSLLAGFGIWFAWDILQVRQGLLPLLRWLSSGGASLGLFLMGDALATRVLLRARQQFRPSIQGLSDQLSVARNADEMSQSIRDAVTRWLPTGGIATISAEEVASIPRQPRDALDRLSEGALMWTEDDPRERRLLVPMRTQDQLRGVLVVSPKRTGGLYTDEDLELLETIASLGALALHNLQVLSEIDELRRVQLEIASGDKRLAIDMLSAEICHEIAYPLNFFRYLLSQTDAGTQLDPDGLEIGREEVARLQRMLARLRKFNVTAPKIGPVRVAPPVARALSLVQETIAKKNIAFSREIPESFEVDAEADSLVQLFANLLRNAVQAAPSNGAVGVTCQTTNAGALIEVWDTGPGIPEETAAAMFRPWVTTREEGWGLGLAITQRILRSFGWSIGFERRGERTCFRIDIPAHAATGASETGAGGAA
jgi:signal transduction histidine kinase